MDGYLETEDLKVALDTGLVWLRVRDECGQEEPACIGPVEDEDRCPPDLWDQWDYLRIEREDALRCGDAYRATVESAWRGRFAPAEWN